MDLNNTEYNIVHLLYSFTMSAMNLKFNTIYTQNILNKTQKKYMRAGKKKIEFKSTNKKITILSVHFWKICYSRDLFGISCYDSDVW